MKLAPFFAFFLGCGTSKAANNDSAPVLPETVTEAVTAEAVTPEIESEVRGLREQILQHQAHLDAIEHYLYDRALAHEGRVPAGWVQPTLDVYYEAEELADHGHAGSAVPAVNRAPLHATVEP
jgi:hypothetical protein